jgi:hypothetical protein
LSKSTFFDPTRALPAGSRRSPPPPRRAGPEQTTGTPWPGEWLSGRWCSARGASMHPERTHYNSRRIPVVIKRRVVGRDGRVG